MRRYLRSSIKRVLSINGTESRVKSVTATTELNISVPRMMRVIELSGNLTWPLELQTSDYAD
jgi:hypothetical protein